MAEEIVTIGDLLNQLRDPKFENKKVFADFLPEAWKVLNLEGEPDLVVLEALLIGAIIHMTTPKKDEPPIIENKRIAKKRDAGLLAFGLLDGYYHTKKDGAHYVAAERHKQYLFDVNYVAITYPDLPPSDELDINDSRSLPRQNISHDDLRCRKDLSETLAISGVCQKCLEKGLKNFTQEIVLPDGNTKRQIILPKPCYTSENFPPDDTSESLSPGDTSESLSPGDTSESLSPGDTSESLSPDDTGSKVKYIKRKVFIRLLIFLICLTFLCMIGFFTYRHFVYGHKQSPHLPSISSGSNAPGQMQNENMGILQESETIEEWNLRSPFGDIKYKKTIKETTYSNQYSTGEVSKFID